MSLLIYSYQGNDKAERDDKLQTTSALMLCKH